MTIVEEDLPCPANVSSDSGLEGETTGRDSPSKCYYEDFVGKKDKCVSLKHGRLILPQPDISSPVCHQRIKRKGDKAGQTRLQSSCKEQNTTSRGLEESSLSTCVRRHHIPHTYTEAAEELHSSSHGAIT